MVRQHEKPRADVVSGLLRIKRTGMPYNAKSGCVSFQAFFRGGRLFSYSPHAVGAKRQSHCETFFDVERFVSFRFSVSSVAAVFREIRG